MPSHEEKVEQIKDNQAYDNVITGKLKLKGRKLPSISQGKKPKKMTKKLKPRESTPAQQRALEVIEINEKTDAELRYERIKQEREKREVAKLASKSYRERVEELNRKIANQSEHYDIPKVGPG